MRHGSLICALLVTLCGCPGGDGAIGDHCSNHRDCAGPLQCVSNTCMPRCERAPDCGDGYRCTDEGLCVGATAQTGDLCRSEVDCRAGLACELEGDELADDGYLFASCVAENGGRPAGATCDSNLECRNGTCDLGHCIDLCTEDRDCGSGTLCTDIPRLVGDAESPARYRGCMQAHGSLRWVMPTHSANELLSLPVPANARSISVMFSVDDPNQKVGATQLFVRRNLADPPQDLLVSDYFSNPYVRHRPELGESVLAMPMSPAFEAQLLSRVYQMRARSLRPSATQVCPSPPCYVQGTATPTVTAVVKVDDGAILDLHFYFLNLDDHPCGAAFGGKLDAATAENAAYFEQFLGEIKNIIGSAVYFELGQVTYEDLRNHPDFDGLNVDSAKSLLALGTHATGINVFFVRTLSPIGLQAVGPNPGPAGLANTRGSGIVIGVDTLCYRSWRELARLTAHEIGRYMGLYENVALDPMHVDPILDSDMTSSNLMFYSELGGTTLSEGQKQILRKSAVLR